MQTLAIEGAKHGIHVNALAPTAATRMTEGLMPEAVLAALKPEAVVPAMLVLAHESAPTRTTLCAGAGRLRGGLHHADRRRVSGPGRSGSGANWRRNWPRCWTAAANRCPPAAPRRARWRWARPWPLPVDEAVQGSAGRRPRRLPACPCPASRRGRPGGRNSDIFLSLAAVPCGATGQNAWLSGQAPSRFLPFLYHSASGSGPPGILVVSVWAGAHQRIGKQE